MPNEINVKLFWQAFALAHHYKAINCFNGTVTGYMTIMSIRAVTSFVVISSTENSTKNYPQVYFARNNKLVDN